MTVTQMNGWEIPPAGGGTNASGGDSLMTRTGTAEWSTTQARTGSRAGRCNPASGASGFFTLSGTTDGWWHLGLYIATMPSVQRRITGLSGGTSVNLRLNSDGTIGYYLGGTLIGTSSTALTTNQWYWIGWIQSSVTSSPVLQINGTTEVSGTTTGFTSSNQIGCNGTEASAIDIYLDDFIIDNATFLAPSKVDTAYPISDNTVTGVTAGAGGTTNLWDAVNNVPAAGVASASETNTTNIEFPASTTCNYLANLETYSDLGINQGDTVLAVRSFVRHGEDVATGTKNIQDVGALTNPTVSGVSTTAGGDAGAHGADTDAGLWSIVQGTLTTTPSVTLGTSPTIRTSRVSQSRVACIDLMCMTVAWTPSTTRVPRLTPYPQMLAH